MTSPPTPAVAAASLFTDGVHSIMTFLNNTDWRSSAFVSKYWYQAAISNRPPRGFEWQTNSTQLHNHQQQQMLTTIITSPIAQKHLTHMTLVDIQHRIDLPHLLRLLLSLSSLRSLKGVQLKSTEPMAAAAVPCPNISFVSHLRELEATSVISVYEQLMEYVGSPAAFPRLTSLTLHNLTLAMDLAPLAASSSLRELHLLQYATDAFTREYPHHSVIVALEKQMSDVSRIPNLTHFTLDNQMAQQLLIDRFDDPSGPKIRFPHLQYFPTMKSIGRFPPCILPNMHLAMPGLRELALLDFFSEEINVCTQFEHLDTVALRTAFPRIENPLELLSQCRALTHLKLIGGTHKLDETWRATFESLPLLTELTFTKSGSQEWNISACLTALVQSDVLEIVSKRLIELDLIEIRLANFEILTQITRLTSLQTLRIQRCHGPQVMTSLTVRDVFNDVHILPRLQHFELCIVSVWFDRQPNEVREPELRAAFVWDVKARKNTDWFRVKRSTEDEEYEVTPPAAPLVGIELNPGPESVFQGLFTDGLHSIFAFLIIQDWLTSIRTCQSWYATLPTQPLRRLTRYERFVECSALLLHIGVTPQCLLQADAMKLARSIGLLQYDLNQPMPNLKGKTPLSLSSLRLSHLLRHIREIGFIGVGGRDIDVTQLSTIMSYLPQLESIVLSLLLSSNWNILRKQTVKEILGPSAIRLQHMSCSFNSYGLVEAVSLVLQHISGCSGLTCLHVSNVPLASSFEPIQSLSLLHTLSISQFAAGCDLNGSRPLPEQTEINLISQLRCIASLPTLRHLDINSSSTNTDPQFMKYALQEGVTFTQLDSFNFGKNIPTVGQLDSIYKLLPKLHRFPRALMLRMADLTLLTKFTQLESLALDRSVTMAYQEDIDTMLIARSLSQLSHLTHLELFGWCFESSQEWSTLFEGAQNLTSLAFNMNETNLLHRLAQSSVVCHRLRILRLAVSGLPISHLPLLRHLASLQSLTLERESFICEGDSDSHSLVSLQSAHLTIYQTFDDPTFMSHLNRIEMTLPSDSEEIKLASLHHTDGWTLVYDRVTRINVDSYRAKCSTDQVALVPPASRLVGIELNPGPPTECSLELEVTSFSTSSTSATSSTSMSTSTPVSATASTLFTDGLHLIFSYLVTIDWIHASCTSHYWLKSGTSSRSRRLIVHSLSSPSSSSSSSASSSSSTSKLFQLHCLQPWKSQLLQISVGSSLSRHITTLNLSHLPIDMTHFISFVNRCTEVEFISAWVKKENQLTPTIIEVVVSTTLTNNPSIPFSYSSRLRELSLNLQHLASSSPSSSSTTTTSIEFLLRGLTSRNSRLTSIQLDHLPLQVSLDSLILLPSLSRLIFDHYAIVILVTSTPSADDCISLRSQWNSLHRLSSLRHLSINRGVKSCIRLARLINISESPTTTTTPTATTATPTTASTTTASASVDTTMVELPQVETFELNLTSDINQLSSLRRLLPNAKFERHTTK